MISSVAAHQKKMEAEKRNKAGKGQAKVKDGVGKKKLATKPSSSSESTTSSSSEGEQPPLKAKAIPKGKEPTLKVPGKAIPRASPAAKPKGKRTPEEPVEV